MRAAQIFCLILFGMQLPEAEAATPPKVVAPSFDCTKARPGSIDVIICDSRELSILDRTMGQHFQRARRAIPATQKPMFRQEQRAFIANRNLCMKRKADRHDCIAFAYEARIIRLGEWIDGSAWEAGQ